MIGAASSRRAFSSLFAIYASIGAVVFVLVIAALAVILVRDHAGRGHAPGTVNARPRLEIAYTAVLVVVVVVLVWRSFVAFSAEDAPVASASDTGSPTGGAARLAVGIIASRWNWRFDYGHGVVQTGHGLEHPARLVVPAGEPIRFRLTARDVVHAFWIPAQRNKYDAVPGRENTFVMVFDRGRDYSGSRCSEFCGTYHDEMTFGVDVLSPPAFRTWLQAREQTTGASA